MIRMEHYTAEMCVYAHMVEIQNLTAALHVAKARIEGYSRDKVLVNRLQETIKREMADLSLLLDRIVDPTIKSMREEKFAKKDKESRMDPFNFENVDRIFCNDSNKG